MGGLYILKDKTPIKVDGVFEWAEGFKMANRIVKQEYIGDTFISTVFLGIDHSWESEIPILFETMIFSGEEEYQERYSTWEEAELGHEKAVNLVKNGKSEDKSGNNHQALD